MISVAKQVAGGVKSALGWLRETFWRFPMRILGSPFKGFDEMKTEKRGSYAFAFAVLIFSALLNIVEYVYTGFLINYNNAYYISSVYLAMVTLFPVALFVTGNWSITTLLDGKGKYSIIFMTMMYAIYPMCLLRVVALVLSNVLTLDEMAFVTAIQVIGAAMFALYLFVGLTVIHEYTFSKSVGSVLLTIAAMMVIAFILMLALSLVADVGEFITVFSREFALKYL